MAFETERGVALRQHPGVDRAVREMTGGAALAHGFVLEDVRSSLGAVALETGFVLREQGGAAAHDRVAFVRVMAVRAGELVRNWMMMRQVEGATHIQVTIKTDVRGSLRVEDQADVPAGLAVQTAGTMARFAPGRKGVGPTSHQPGMAGGFEIPDQLVVALGASFFPDKRDTRNRRRSHDGPRERAARNDNGGKRGAREQQAELAAS